MTKLILRIPLSHLSDVVIVIVPYSMCCTWYYYPIVTNDSFVP